MQATMGGDVDDEDRPRGGPQDDERYEEFQLGMRDHFARATKGGQPLFATDAEGLYDVFLSRIPEGRRQRYRCNACRRFVEKYGGVVCVRDGDGSKFSPLWDGPAGRVLPEHVPPFFAEAVVALARGVAKARIVGVFVSSEERWGVPENMSSRPPYEWRHMHVLPTEPMVFRKTPLKDAGQHAAEKREEHAMLLRGLADFPADVVQQTHALLAGGNLYRSEKCLRATAWLRNLHAARAVAGKGERADNLTWLAVARAPAGFCHVRSGMVGTLLADVAAGLPFAEIQRRFGEKMDPLMYQRPQAPPSEGNVAEAERVVCELASAGSLARRFARVEDLETLWTPKPATPPAPLKGGVFAHIATKSSTVAAAIRTIQQPTITMTWDKFSRTVLPGARRVELQVSDHNRLYGALVTAADMGAPPIVQWDRPEKRNPVTWYVYRDGSPPGEWNLKPGWCPVTAVTLQPSMWGGGDAYARHGASVFLILEGAKDMRRRVDGKKIGGGFFPELLRSEYHPVRSTLEAFEKSAEVHGADEATACGLKVEKAPNGSRPWGHVLRVTCEDGSQLSYELDRWD